MQYVHLRPFLKESKGYTASSELIVLLGAKYVNVEFAALWGSKKCEYGEFLKTGEQKVRMSKFSYLIFSAVNKRRCRQNVYKLRLLKKFKGNLHFSILRTFRGVKSVNLVNFSNP